MRKNKKGDQYAALLIAIIGLSIIIYILMLPPKDRAELLGENISEYGDSPYEEYDKVEVLLEKTPGTLEFLSDDTIEIEIPSFSIYTKKSGEILASFDSIYIRKSVFSEDVKNITFEIEDLKFTENVLLSFTALNRSGRLTIKLNGESILDKELTTDSPAPIQLQKSLLREDNIITFEVSGPGAEFWKSNEYVLENIKITADITDISGQENKQFFIITEQQKRLMQTASLSFVTDCSEAETIPLEIYLNKKLTYSGIPDCGAKTEIDIDKAKLVEGDNNLWSVSDGGNYLLYSIKIEMELEEPIQPTYFFDISEEKYELIDDGDADINISIVFPNSVDYKKGEIHINDHTIEIETRDAYLSRNINSFVREGSNALEIVPKRGELQITEVKVVYGE